MSGYAIATTLEAPLAEAVARTREAPAGQGFGVLTEIDVAATMRAELDVEVPAQLSQKVRARVISTAAQASASGTPRAASRAASAALGNPRWLDDTRAGVGGRDADPGEPAGGRHSSCAVSVSIATSPGPVGDRPSGVEGPRAEVLGSDDVRPQSAGR